jgi:hypothetical protein
VQTLLRHADVHTTLQLYAQGNAANGLAAQGSMLDAIGLPLPENGELNGGRVFRWGGGITDHFFYNTLNLCNH